MKNYLVGIWYCGEDLSTKRKVEARNEKELWEKIHLVMRGYGDLEDSIEDLKTAYEEENYEAFEMSIDDIKKEINWCEDIVEFVFDCDNLRMIWECDIDV